MGERIFGVNVPSEDEIISAQRRSPFKISFTLANPKEVKDIEDSFNKLTDFQLELFRNLVFEIHKYLIRLTPMDTGRLRGGWTGILNKYQEDYSRQIRDTSLYDVFKNLNITPHHKEYHFDPTAVLEGAGESQIEDKTPNQQEIAIDNKVPYKDFLDFGRGVHFTTRARYVGELWFTRHYNRWLAAMEEEGKVVAPPSVEEINF